MTEWQIVTLIALLACLALAVVGLSRSRLDRATVLNSAAVWGVIVLLVTMIVLNRDLIAGTLQSAIGGTR